MRLTSYDIKKILNPKRYDSPIDDFRIIDSWTEYDEEYQGDINKRPLRYMCYQLEVIDPDTGEKRRYFKAVKFLRVIRLPKSAKQSTSFMDIQTAVLASVYQNGINLITIIANIIEPEPLGLLYLYGVQGVAETIDRAKEIAHDGYLGFAGAMQGSFRVLEMRCINAEETEWLREKMYGMDYLTVVRGIPKANEGGEDAGNKGMGGRNINPDSQGTLEEIIVGMADYEYIIEILSTPVYKSTLEEWSARTERDMTDWQGQLQGTKSFSFNLSIPMMFSNNQSTSEGWNRAYTDADSVSYSRGESFSTGFGENVGHTLSESYSQSFGETFGQSVTNSVSQSHGISQGASIGQSSGQSFGQSLGRTLGVTEGESASISQSQSINHSEGYGVSHGQSVSQGTSYGLSQGQSIGSSHSFGQNASVSSSVSNSASASNSASVSQSQSVSQSESVSESFGDSMSESTGSTNTHTAGTNQSTSNTHTEGASAGVSMGESETSGWNVGGSIGVLGNGINGGYSHSSSESWTENTSTSQSDAVGNSSGISESDSVGVTNSSSLSSSHSQGATAGSSQTAGNSVSQSESYSQSSGYTEGVSMGSSESWGVTSGRNMSETWGVNQNVSENQSVSQNVSDGWGESIGMNQGASRSQSVSSNAGQNIGANMSQNYSQNISESQSVSQSKSVGQSYSQSVTQGVSEGVSDSYGQSRNVSQGQNYTQGEGRSISQSLGSSGAYVTGTAASMGLGPSIGYNKSYQWLDQQVKDILELLTFQNERIKQALRGNGAFYTYVYIACPSQDALSTAMAAAKSTWHNELAMTHPLQVLNLPEDEQRHLLYHLAAFSTDVTREDVYGVKDYKYATVLLPNEYVAYTHLPRISEGGVFAEVNDVPKFAVPSMMKGEIFMGTILSAERYTMKNGYKTHHDYRIDESELMHGFFTGASRSGKTVAAMRFVAELAQVRRKKTGKRMRIFCMDPKQDWRTLARFVEPERFHFYNIGRMDFRPIKINPLKIPRGVTPQFWADGIIDIYCRAYGLLERGKQMMGETIYSLYEEAGVFQAEQYPDWKDRVPELSRQVTFTKVYERMTRIKASLEDPTNPKGRAGNDTRDAYARLLDRLQAFSRPYSVEHKLFGTEEGIGIDELIGGDDVTVVESKGLENTFRNFIFGVITSGFYKVALAHEGGFLADDQYETALIIEEANEVLTGNDVAGTGGGQQFGMTGQSEFEQILDQAAGYGLYIFAITQKIADMPKSIIANSGLIFAGRLKTPDDITVVMRAIAKEDRFDDRDIVKWFPRQPTGWFICQSSRTYDFKDAEPILVNIARLNIAPPSNAEIDEILIRQNASGVKKKNSAA